MQSFPLKRISFSHGGLSLNQSRGAISICKNNKKPAEQVDIIFDMSHQEQ